MYVAPSKELAEKAFKYLPSLLSASSPKCNAALLLDDAAKGINPNLKPAVAISSAEYWVKICHLEGKCKVLDSFQFGVIDELQHISNSKEGPTMEIVSSWLRRMRPQPRIVAFSAPVGNAKEMAEWLCSTLGAINHCRRISTRR